LVGCEPTTVFPTGSPVRLQADETEQEEGQDRKSVRKAPKEKVAQELSDVLYLKSVHFDSFQQFKGASFLPLHAGLTPKLTNPVFLQRRSATV